MNRQNTEEIFGQSKYSADYNSYIQASNYTFNAIESTHTKGIRKPWALGGNEESINVG